MALISCPECGHDVSERAVACPHCGHPMALEPGTEAGQSYSKADALQAESLDETASAPEVKARQPRGGSSNSTTRATVRDGKVFIAPAEGGTARSSSVLPEYAGAAIRLGSWLLEGVLVLVTLYIGWIIWAIVTSADGHGQTPAKRLLGLRVIREDRGEPAGFLWMLLVRGLLAGIVAALVITITLGIILFMPLWDKRNRNIWDAVSGCVVIRDPNGQFAPGGGIAATADSRKVYVPKRN